MKIAVVGMGVAGAYLMNGLSNDHDNYVKGFERMPIEEHDAVCAWATCENVMEGLIKECGLKFDDYVLHEGKRMKVDMSQSGKEQDSIDVGLKGMVTYDKIKLIKDMTRGTDIQFGVTPKKENLESEFDIIIDATGFHRNYLPRPQNETWIPCVQYKVKYHDKTPFDDFYLKAFPSMKGYFWYFPLENGYAHIGAGDYERKNNNVFVDEFLKKHECEVIKKVGRPVRISPPRNSEPFTDGRKTIGVGESIGTVYPLLGEGIIPSTWCAQLFIKHISDFKTYRREVLKKFQIYALVFKFIQMKINGKFNLFKNAVEVLKIYNHMKHEEKRYGMEVKLKDLIKVSRI